MKNDRLDFFLKRREYLEDSINMYEEALVNLKKELFIIEYPNG